MKPFWDRHSSREGRYNDIEVELTRMVFHNILVTMTLAMIAVAGTTSLLAHLYRDANLWRFNAVMSTISLTRVALIAAFNRGSHLPLTPRAASRWITVYSALALLSFTVTASFIVYNFSHHDATGRVLSAVSAFILCAGLSGRLSARPKVDQLAGIIIMGGLFWGVARSGERFAWVVCLMLVMFVYGHCAAVQNRFDLTVEQLRGRRKLRELADHDVLTGLANRRSFEAALTRLCGESTSFAVLFLDLDGFKQINDTLGHATGDILLDQVAQRLKRLARNSDLIARLGGDEFAILHAPRATSDSAGDLAQRIIESISAPYEIEGHPVSVGTSIGIQLSSQTGLNDPTTLLSEADRALYLVKQNGKGDFRFAVSAEAAEVSREQSQPPLLGVTSQFA